MVSSKAATVADYLAELPEERRAIVSEIRDRINAAIPKGYREGMGFGMIGWVVPMEVSGPTYNGQPLAYVSLAAQKNNYSLYLTCAYISKEREQRIRDAFEQAGHRLDMGKSCIRFTDPGKLAWSAIAKEIAAYSPEEFVRAADEARKSGRC